MAEPLRRGRRHPLPPGGVRPAALGQLRRIIEGPSTYRTEILRALTARPAAADLATLIAMADTDEVVRLRLLRAIRDLGV